MKYILDETTKSIPFWFPPYIKEFLSKKFEKEYGGLVKEHFVVFANNTAKFYAQKDDLARLGFLIIKGLKEKKIDLKKNVKRLEENNKEFEKLLTTKNIEKKSYKDLIEHLKKIYVCYKCLLVLGMVVEPFNRAADKIVEKEKIPKEDLNILVTPTVKSYLDRYMEELGKLVNEIKRKKLQDMFEKEDLEKIDYYVKKYTWINSGHFCHRPLSRKEVVGHIKDLLNAQPKKIDLSKKKNLMEKYKLSEDFLTVINSIDNITQIHDMRKELFAKFSFYMNNVFFKEIGKRLGFDVESVTYFDFEEDIFDKKIDKKLLKDKVRKRKGLWIRYSDGKTYKEYTGEEAKKFLDKINKNLYVVKEEIIRGSSVNVEDIKVKGIARIIYGPTEKFEEGKILVTTMTKPAFFPLMKKAKAIITDEGGVTCHAAIISREIGVPCITGTKIATKVLKDGDEIEVNANHGVVKILKRKGG